MDLNKNNDFFLPKEENMQQVLPPQFLDTKGPYLVSNLHPNIPVQMQQSQLNSAFPFTHFDSRYSQISPAQMAYPNNGQISLGYPPYSFDRFNNLPTDLTNKLQVAPSFDITKQNPEDLTLAQRTNVGVNFLPNVSVPLLGYPVYPQGYPPPPDRLNVNLFHTTIKL